MQVTLDHSEPLTEHIRLFWFKPERPVRYQAGQFIQFSLPHAAPDSRGEKRWFTLTSSPTEDLLAITTKQAPENGSSFKRTLFALQPGTPVQFSEPMGDFVLPKDPAIPLLFVTGGIGITPMRSMTKYLLDSHEQRQIQVLYGVREPAELVFEPLFRDYGANFTAIVSEPAAGWSGETGRLSAAKIVALDPQAPAKRIYLSGPEPMIEALYKELLAYGIAKDQMITDYFPGYTN